MKKVYVLIFSIIFILCFFSIIYFYYFIRIRPIQVFGEAMSPNYNNGEHYLVLTNKKDKLERGIVVVHEFEFESSPLLIKRVIGLPGEKIYLKDGKVYIDDNLLNEVEYTNSNTNGGDFISILEELEIPENHYFVLSDNRNEGIDSRTYGFVQLEDIIGEVMFCYANCKD